MSVHRPFKCPYLHIYIYIYTLVKVHWLPQLSSAHACIASAQMANPIPEHLRIASLSALMGGGTVEAVQPAIPRKDCSCRMSI